MYILDIYLNNYKNFKKTEWYSEKNIHDIFSFYRMNMSIAVITDIPYESKSEDWQIIKKILNLFEKRTFEDIFANEVFLILSFYLSWKKYDLHNLNNLFQNKKRGNEIGISLFYFTR